MVGATISLLVGLGNPGPQYEQTRHNVGFWLVNKFAAQHDVVLKMEMKFKGMVGSTMVGNTATNHPLHLLLPQTFMNLSGQAVVTLAHFYKIPFEQILVVHDELDFMPGVVRFKKGGGANGHNGVQNIIDLLGSNNFHRLRIGIGKPENKDKMIDYVTNRLSRSDEIVILDAIDATLKVLPIFLVGEFDRAIEKLHKMGG